LLFLDEKEKDVSNNVEGIFGLFFHILMEGIIYTSMQNRWEEKKRKVKER
jgi:hypothetical protein